METTLDDDCRTETDMLVVDDEPARAIEHILEIPWAHAAVVPVLLEVVKGKQRSGRQTSSTCRESTADGLRCGRGALNGKLPSHLWWPGPALSQGAQRAEVTQVRGGGPTRSSTRTAWP